MPSKLVYRHEPAFVHSRANCYEIAETFLWIMDLREPYGFTKNSYELPIQSHWHLPFVRFFCVTLSRPSATVACPTKTSPPWKLPIGSRSWCHAVGALWNPAQDRTRDISGNRERVRFERMGHDDHWWRELVRKPIARSGSGRDPCRCS
jgi:hypothetical protein